MRFFRPQARRRSPAALLALILAAAAPARGADPPGGVEYDIVRADDSLAVWLNLTPFFGHPEYRSLQDGIDYACEIAIELQRPRKLFGAVPVTKNSCTIRLSYRLLTEAFRVQTSGPGQSAKERLLLSREEAEGFLADSVVVRVAALAGLPADRDYRITLDISRIALTGINLAVDDDTGSVSPVKTLFREFLRLTNYGREEWSTTSRSFSLSEVLPRR